MTTHVLKTVLAPFEATWIGVKAFELRLNDRHYAVGDTLILREWDPGAAQFRARAIRVVVTHLTSGGLGLLPGYCVLGVRIDVRYTRYQAANG
jgi:Domain of unknown function (DUF3850)